MINIDEVRDELNEYLASNKLGANALARSLGISPAAISTFKAGTYKGNNEAVARKIKSYLNALSTKKDESVEPKNAKELFKSVDFKMSFFAINEAIENSEIALIYGEAGSGKSTILKEFLKENPNAILIEATPHTTARSLIENICEELKVSANSMEAKLKAISKHLASCDRVLLVDEAEHLPLKALESLRRIHDFSACPLVLVGTEILLRNLLGKNKELRQLYSRIGSKWIMKGLSKDESKECYGDGVYELCGGNFRASAKLHKKALKLAEFYNESSINSELLNKAAEMVVLV
ncbi:MAG: AAA family ATPase [Campylobacter sp.]|uniref:AAA family ATPase n=1 Tax=Campylobacter sp. TaxID=205 RepID=UPI001B4B9FA2|nr:AAA family ATPase [Campylobacter sp.]MBP3675117.1 AAA family ATPase [Campylobacter sp.]